MLKISKSKEGAKLQWLQDPSEINGDMKIVRLETSRHIRNKKGGYLKVTKLISLQQTLRKRLSEACIGE
jgi:hypothetical protein